MPEQPEAAPEVGGANVEEATETHHLHALGQGRRRFDNREAPSDIRALMQRGPFSRKRCLEYYSLPATIKVGILNCLISTLSCHRSADDSARHVQGVHFTVRADTWEQARRGASD